MVTLLLGCLAQSCETETDDYQSGPGPEYFPLEVGKYKIYEVDSTIFDPTGDSLIAFSKTFFKEEVVDTLTDNQGEIRYKVERYERNLETAPWQVTKVFTRSIHGNQAIETIDNLRFIKITFPVRKNNTWDGLVYFDPGLIVTVAGESIEMFKGWSYRVLDAGLPDSVGQFAFQDVATIQESDMENLIELRKSTEKYALGLGLVYRERWILDTQCIEDCEGLGWEEKAEKGFIVKQKIIGFN